MIAVTFQPHHTRVLDYRTLERVSMGILGNSEKRFEQVSQFGPAYTILHRGIVIGCAGIVVYWEGMGEGWLVGSTHMADYKLSFHKAILRSLPMVAEGLRLKRLQIGISSHYPHFARWAKKLGFHYEGVMRHFNPDGSDSIRMARFWK